VLITQLDGKRLNFRFARAAPQQQAYGRRVFARTDIAASSEAGLVVVRPPSSPARMEALTCYGCGAVRAHRQVLLRMSRSLIVQRFVPGGACSEAVPLF